MKKHILIFFILILASHLFADSFTDAIQDLAIVIACKGTYAGSEAINLI